MTKKLIKKFLPNTQKIREHRQLKIFGHMIHNPNLWHLNRYSVATACSIGLFSAFVPIPMQMLLAAALAIPLRANLPISVALVWLTNPITMPPIFYFCFKVGASILEMPPTEFHFEATPEWLSSSFLRIWKPFLLGCLLVGSTASLLSNLLVRIIWRISVTRSWLARLEKRKNQKNN